MGLGGVTLPVSETGIALSLLVIGLLVTWRVQMPASVGVVLKLRLLQGVEEKAKRGELVTLSLKSRPNSIPSPPHPNRSAVQRHKQFCARRKLCCSLE